MSQGADRDLSGQELRALAAELARSEEVSDFVLEAGATRTYRELFRTEHASAWVIRWGEDADTGFHDHDVSAGAVSVLEGEVREERLAVGGRPRVSTYGPGGTFSLEATDIHRVTRIGDVPALTVHVYSPALTQMGAYMIEPSGLLRRMTISYEEELRPLTPV